MAGMATAQTAAGSSKLLEKHAALKDKLANNAYGRPLYLESTESGDLVSGNAYAVLDAPFATVSTSFRNANTWCDVMILHINTKYCKTLAASNPAILKVHVGKKTPQTLDDSFGLEFAMRQGRQVQRGDGLAGQQHVNGSSTVNNAGECSGQARPSRVWVLSRSPALPCGSDSRVTRCKATAAPGGRASERSPDNPRDQTDAPDTYPVGRHHLAICPPPN